jgi:hypothetical protein
MLLAIVYDLADSPSPNPRKNSHFELLPLRRTEVHVDFAAKDEEQVIACANPKL